MAHYRMYPYPLSSIIIFIPIGPKPKYYILSAEAYCGPAQRQNFGPHPEGMRASGRLGVVCQMPEIRASWRAGPSWW